MPPKINRKETGINLRRIMDRRGLSVKDIQQYLGLDSVQSIYHWLNGLSMPTLDNLYSLSALFQVTLDELVCGDREPVGGELLPSEAVCYGFPVESTDHRGFPERLSDSCGLPEQFADSCGFPERFEAARARRIYAYYKAISSGHAA